VYCTGNRSIFPGKEMNPTWLAAEENPTLAVEESASLSQVETVAPGVEATLPEASVVEGK
jgi:hypothetical protein